MSAADHYPSVTIVAGPIRLASNPVGTFGYMIRMHEGASYITITPEIAAQWLPVLQQIADSK